MLVDNLFLEGKLQAVNHPLANKLRELWVSVGLLYDPKTDRRRRLEQLVVHLERAVPPDNAHYKDWLAFVPAWAEAALLYHKLIHSDNHVAPQFETLQSRVDTAFLLWMMVRFKSLASLPPRPPVVVHHIPRYLAVKRKAFPKLALIVLDGMAFDQWLVIRPVLQKQLPGLHFRERAVFSWIPTLTSVSRQAIFAGQAPMYFPNSITITAKEPRLWAKFWENNGLTAAAVGYAKALRSGPDLAKVDLLLSHPKLKVLGLVVDQVDQMIHGTKLGTAGLHQQVRLWTEGGFLAKLLRKMRKSGFQVYMAADHGNVQARGIGRPSEGALADVRGQRVRLYSNETLRKKIQEDYPQAIAWSPDGLPPDYFPLLAPARSAFVQKDAAIVSHGGVSLEEVVVPLVKVEWED